jgi:hypothetical protein
VLVIQATNRTKLIDLVADNFQNPVLPDDFDLYTQLLSTYPQTLLISVTPHVHASTISGTVTNQSLSDAAPDHPFSGATGASGTLSVTAPLSAEADSAHASFSVNTYQGVAFGGGGEIVDLGARGPYGAWSAGQGLDLINGFVSGPTIWRSTLPPKTAPAPPRSALWCGTGCGRRRRRRSRRC